MVFYLKISSKTKPLLLKFISFFLQLRFLSCLIINRNSFNNKKFLTVLKSPHVNKTAQEQFEFRNYKCQFLVFSPKPLLLLLILKKLFRFTFLGLKLELKVLFQSSNDLQKKSLNPNFFIIKSVKKSFVKVKHVGGFASFKEKSVLKYIQLFDSFGEANLKHVLLD